MNNRVVDINDLYDWYTFSSIEIFMQVFYLCNSSCVAWYNNCAGRARMENISIKWGKFECLFKIAILVRCLGFVILWRNGGLSALCSMHFSI